MYSLIFLYISVVDWSISYVLSTNYLLLILRLLYIINSINN